MSTSSAVVILLYLVSLAGAVDRDGGRRRIICRGFFWYRNPVPRQCREHSLSQQSTNVPLRLASLGTFRTLFSWHHRSLCSPRITKTGHHWLSSTQLPFSGYVIQKSPRAFAWAHTSHVIEADGWCGKPQRNIVKSCVSTILCTLSACTVCQNMSRASELVQKLLMMTRTLSDFGKKLAPM